MGQGMTEYIIIVALISVAAIGVYTQFGNVVKAQTGVIAAELSAQDSKDAKTEANADAVDAAAKGTKKKTLADFNAANK